MTWEKLLAQFWLDTRIPVSNDLDDWRALSEDEKDTVAKVFGGLTLLDTLQSENAIARLEKSARTKHEIAVYSNIKMMECYTKDHKLLTKNGWKNIDEVNLHDEVLSYDTKTNKTRFCKVLNTSSHTPNSIYKLKKGLFELKVSPGHRVLYEEAKEKSGGLNAYNKYYTKVIEAKDFDNNVPKTYYYRIPKIKEFDSGIEDAVLTPLERFLIAFQADGSLKEIEHERYFKYKNNKNSLESNKLNFNFSFSKERKIERLLNIVEVLGDDGVVIKELLPDNRGNRKRNFSVKVPIDILPEKFFHEHGNRDKVFSNWFAINKFSGNKAKEFIEELSNWDCHKKVNTDGVGHILYFTAIKENAEFVMAISTLAGYSFANSKRVDNRKDSYKNSYIVRISTTPFKQFITNQNMEITKHNPEKVFGVEVETGFLVVRHLNGIVISGNCVHAKSYSTIFSTLNTKAEIDEIFNWVHTNPYLQKKAEMIDHWYQNGDKLQAKVASVYLESFSFYSGFFLPLWYLGNNKMPNVAEIIKLIVRDESLHGTYIGYKFQKDYELLPKEYQEDIKEWAYHFLMELYDNEVHYAQELYDKLGLTEKVKVFMRYNANKALQNLGFEPLFPDTAEDVDPIVMNGISTGTNNHD